MGFLNLLFFSVSVVVGSGGILKIQRSSSNPLHLFSSIYLMSTTKHFPGWNRALEFSEYTYEHRYPYVCIDMNRHAHTCIGIRRCTQVSSGLHVCADVSTCVDRITLVISGFHVCADVSTCVHMFT